MTAAWVVAALMGGFWIGYFMRGCLCALAMLDPQDAPEAISSHPK